MPITSLLIDWGFHVTVADSFQRAKACLVERPPRILVTDVQLASYNGLGLVLRGRAENPDLAAIVMSRTDDPVLRQDADLLNATFIVKPIEERELRAAAVRTLLQRDRSPAAWPIRPPFERRTHDRRRASTPASPERRTGERRVDVAAALSAIYLVNGANSR
jgi:DNA-binding response OmpR family regulator